MIKSIILRTAIVLIGILVVFLGRGFFYYTGSYSASPSEMPSYEHIVAPAAPSTEFSDTYEEGEGTILIDLAHDNAFDVEELNVLILRLISRGLTIEFFNAGDDLEKGLSGEEEDQEEELFNEKWQEQEEEDQEDESLNGKWQEQEEEDQEEEDQEKKPPTIAFIIVCPQEEFSEEERKTINEFVDNGGKLLLIDDPTRKGNTNAIFYDFGLIFEPDYLYNMEENDANYRNIFITKFKESQITRKLQKIALYTAGSISSADGGIVFGDENTFSSLKGATKKLSPIVLVEEAKILAVYDLTFISEPYNGILDNNQLIANIADWLASPTEQPEEEQE